MKAQTVFTVIIAILLSSCGQKGTPPPAELPSPTIKPTEVVTAAPELTFTPTIPAGMDEITGRPGHVQVLTTNTLGKYVLREFLQIPVVLAWGPDSMLYIADQTGRHVVRVTRDGKMDDLPFWKTVPELQKDGPRGIAFDSKGNMYVSNHRNIFRIEPDGTVTNLPDIEGKPIGSIVISPADELYYTNRAAINGSLRKWSNGKSETIIWDLPFAENMLFGLDGSLYLAPMGQGTILKIDLDTKTVSTFKEGVCGNDPCFLALDRDGDIWARAVNGLSQFSPDGRDKLFKVDGQVYPLDAPIWESSAGIAFDDEGRLWIASYNSKLRRLDPVDPGQADPSEFTLQMIAPGFQASDLEIGSAGEIYGSDENSRRIARVNPDGSVETFFDYGRPGRLGLALSKDGVLYVGLAHGEIVRIEADGSATHYASLISRRMAFGSDGALYAVVDDPGNQISIARITGVDEYEVVATGIGDIPLGDTENSEVHISPALGSGFYLYKEDTCDLLYMDLNGQGHRIADLSILGCSRPAIMAASPVTGDIFLIMHGPYRLFRITPAGDIKPIATEIFGDPWGMVVSPDGKWIYVAESGAIDKIPLSEVLP